MAGEAIYALHCRRGARLGGRLRVVVASSAAICIKRPLPLTPSCMPPHPKSNAAAHVCGQGSRRLEAPARSILLRRLHGR